MRIRHLVHSCLLVEVAGRRVLVDPGVFSADAVHALDPELRGGIDVVAITHQHADHVSRPLLAEVLAANPEAVVVAEPETAELLEQEDAGPMGEGPAVPRGRVLSLAAGAVHRFPALDGEEELTVTAVGGRHAIIHPDIPRVGNCGMVLRAGEGPRLGLTGDSLEPVQEFHGIDVLAFALVAPWSKMSETIEFLREVRPVLALPVHDAVASAEGRPIFVRQAGNLAPEGTEVRDWAADGVVEI